MINPEDIIGEVLQPLRDNSTIGFYHYGNEDELKVLFDSQSYQTKYPFVWLKLPLEGNPVENTRKDELDTRLRLILATNTQKEWLNDKRNLETYGKVLNPLYDKVKETLTKSTNVLIKTDQITVKKLHNYYKTDLGTRENPQKRTVNAYWDVIVMEFDTVLKPLICKP